SRPRDRFRRLEPAAGLACRKHGDDFPVPDRDGMVLQDHAVRLDRHNPAGFDQQVAGLRHAHLTRPTYSPERVSTLISSSWLTNSGTRTPAPVSSVAGLPPPPEVSPRRPGSVSVIFSSTKFGGWTMIGVPFQRVTTHSSSPLSHLAASPMPAASACTCSKVDGSMKCQCSPSL